MVLLVFYILMNSWIRKNQGKLFDMNYFLLRKGSAVDKLNAFGERFLESVSFD